MRPKTVALMQPTNIVKFSESLTKFIYLHLFCDEKIKLSTVEKAYQICYSRRIPSSTFYDAYPPLTRSGQKSPIKDLKLFISTGVQRCRFWHTISDTNFTPV